MKILHITATHLRANGGIPYVLENLVNEQNLVDGLEAKVLSLKADPSHLNSNNFDFVPNKSNIETYISTFSPDIVIFHGVYFVEYTKIISFLDKIKYFIEPHGSFSQESHKKGNMKKKIALRLIFKKFIENTYGFIFLNENERKKSLYKTSNDLVIPNGVSLPEKEIQRRYSEVTKIIFLGRLDINHKGLDILLSQLSNLKEYHKECVIEFYGTSSEKEKKIIEKYIRNIKNMKITLNGPVYGEEKENLLMDADLMILTSRYEGFPISILEGFSYGLPCIVSTGTNIDDIVLDNKLGWVCTPETINETIITAVNEFQKDPEKYSKRVYQYAKTHLAWDRIAKYSKEVFKNIS